MRERRAEKIKDDREGSYLSILVVSHLDRFANGCWHVALDDGTVEGRPAGDDHVSHQTTVKAPKFKPLDIEVEWRVLPKALMYDILQIPDRQEHVDNRIAGAGEFADPPEYTDFFMARQREYAELGLHVSAITSRLRKHASMSIEDGPPGEWTRDVSLREIIDKIDNRRAEWEKRQAVVMD